MIDPARIVGLRITHPHIGEIDTTTGDARPDYAERFEQPAHQRVECQPAHAFEMLPDEQIADIRIGEMARFNSGMQYGN